MTRLNGATVHLNATNHLVIGFAGYTGIVHIGVYEAGIYQALVAAVDAEAESHKKKVQQTETARLVKAVGA
jgi:hypothetical protein